MLLHLLAVAVGLILLVWSADRFVVGACVTAERIGVPVLVIGMLLMGFGTSAPEMLVSLQASLDDNPGLAVGNALGSNITNIALILGLTALLRPVVVGSTLIKRELPILLLITLLASALLFNLQLVFWKGLVLLLALVAFIGYSWWLAQQGKSDALLDEVNEVLQPMSQARAVFWLLLGLLVLVVSARLLVWGAVAIAQTLGVSDLVIGLTLVAIGTSLPELAASIAAARRNQADLVIGNVIGSNIFNLLAVLPIPALLVVGSLDPALVWRDLPVMLGLTLLLLVFAIGRQWQGRINRYEGVALLMCFVGYQWWLFG
ncbi:calcium/sodium antiporter [Marinospirillum alkaliphilum]|uniref:Cation:H+ antiporter n=1 Tax=Marinospirillum alkaliphilum DSM 21637 TaxID=1122209 RepID=A0A1K1UFU3_9GAMM|nr:calcium/sodium antiporter [Marinospirillum alkaliphilum]SFX11452.1 cation:H+ antiporter [Marinospirillum alkaliphilum DSM 21637]